MLYGTKKGSLQGGEKALSFLCLSVLFYSFSQGVSITDWQCTLPLLQKGIPVGYNDFLVLRYGASSKR